MTNKVQLKNPKLSKKVTRVLNDMECEIVDLNEEISNLTLKTQQQHACICRQNKQIIELLAQRDFFFSSLKTALELIK